MKDAKPGSVGLHNLSDLNKLGETLEMSVWNLEN